jgi:hypothetical protein
MKRYTVTLVINGTAQHTVDAESEDEAIDEAREHFIKHNSLRSYCYGEIADEVEIEESGEQPND